MNLSVSVLFTNISVTTASAIPFSFVAFALFITVRHATLDGVCLIFRGAKAQTSARRTDITPTPL